MMERVTYDDLVTRFGAAHALKLLRGLEALTALAGTIVALDRNVRLQQVLDALNQPRHAA